jgi:hypothetical protein
MLPAPAIVLTFKRTAQSSPCGIFNGAGAQIHDGANRRCRCGLGVRPDGQDRNVGAYAMEGCIQPKLAQSGL